MELIETRRKSSSILYLLLPIIISMVAMRTVNASVSTINWLGAAYEGYDSFLGTSVVAYEEGSEVNLLVKVYSNFYVGYPFYSYRPVNVSAVKLWVDWDVNYTSTEVSEDYPVVIEPYQYHTFTITFTTPNIAVASNLVAHNYRIYVEHVHSTLAGAKEIVGVWTYSGSGLAVYSSEQADCMEMYQKYMGMSIPDFTYPEAEVLWSKALVESGIALRSYARGDFTDAYTRFQAMDDLVDQAFNTEATKGSATADAVTVNANAALMQSYGYILLGVGVTFFGIGVVIFGLRRQP